MSRFPARLRSGLAARSALALALLAAATGCTTPRPRTAATPPPIELVNVAGADTGWPHALRRVVILPAHGVASALPETALAPLERAWFDALIASHRAEFVTLSRDQLARLGDGRRSLGSGDRLPAALFESLRLHTGADAVLWLDVTAYSPYPPLALGVRAKLVHLDDATILWACDERVAAPEGAPREISPGRFTARVFDAVAATLPRRSAR